VVVHDLNAAVGLDVPEDEGFETVAGLVLARLGRIPRTGDWFIAHGARFEVTEATPTSVRRVRVRRVDD
jgi:putative hemolysin